MTAVLASLVAAGLLLYGALLVVAPHRAIAVARTQFRFTGTPPRAAGPRTVLLYRLAGASLIAVAALILLSLVS